jgi:hypothetical protein
VDGVITKARAVVPADVIAVGVEAAAIATGHWLSPATFRDRVERFLPASWDHLICQSWDHSARRAERFWIRSLTACVMTNDVEVNGDGFQGGQCGRGA